MPQNVIVPPFDEAPETVVGGTPEDVFEFEFPFWDADDILVYVDDVLIPSSEYGVEGLALQDGEVVEGGYGSGTITLETAVSDCTVRIDRMVVGDRETAFSRSSPLDMRALNGDLNRITARMQDLKRRFDDLDPATAAADAGIAAAQAVIATAQAAIAVAQAATATTAAASAAADAVSAAADAVQTAADRIAAETARNEAEAIVAATATSASYATDAAGRTGAGVDGAQYWLRTTDGLLMRTRVTSSTSENFLVSGQPVILLSVNGLYNRQQFIRFEVTALGANNDYTVRPFDHSMRLGQASGGGTEPLWCWEVPEENVAGSGGITVTVLNGDGTTFITAAIRKDNNTSGLEPGDHQLGDLFIGRRMTAAEDAGQRIRWLQPTDMASRRLARMGMEMAVTGWNPSPDRPVKFGFIGANTYSIVGRPSEDAYINGAAPRQSDRFFAWFFDSGEFQGDPSSRTFNSYGSAFGNLPPDQACNLLFGEVDGGRSVNTGLPPSTFESVPFGGDDADPWDVALTHFPAGGYGHGHQDGITTQVDVFLSDSTTPRVVTAATAADPVVLTIPAAGGFSDAGGWVAGDRRMLSGVTGMTQLNGVEFEVVSVAGATVTTDIDGSAFSAFTAHDGTVTNIIDMTDATIATGFQYGDRIRITDTCLLTNDSNDAWCRATYVRWIDPARNLLIGFETSFDPDDAGVTVSVPVLSRAVMIPIPTRDINCFMACRAGTWDPTVYEIDLRDGSSTTYGKANAVVMWHTTNPRRKYVWKNLMGYATPGVAASLYSHWEDSGLGEVPVTAAFDAYVANNDWGGKFNDGQIDYAVSHSGKRDITGIRFGTRYAIAVFEDGDPDNFNPTTDIDLSVITI